MAFCWCVWKKFSVPTGKVTTSQKPVALIGSLIRNLSRAHVQGMTCTWKLNSHLSSWGVSPDLDWSAVAGQKGEAVIAIQITNTNPDRPYLCYALYHIAHAQTIPCPKSLQSQQATSYFEPSPWIDFSLLSHRIPFQKFIGQLFKHPLPEP